MSSPSVTSITAGRGHSAAPFEMRMTAFYLMLATASACTSATSTDADTIDNSAKPTNPATSGGSLNGHRVFPADNAWNTDISRNAVDPNSSTLIASCGLRNLHQDFGTTYDGAPNGIPYVVVGAVPPWWD